MQTIYVVVEYVQGWNGCMCQSILKAFADLKKAEEYKGELYTDADIIAVKLDYNEEEEML
jgi:hypothetical protein